MNLSANIEPSHRRNEIYLILFFCFLIGFNPITNASLSAIRRIVVLPLKLDVIFFYAIYVWVVVHSIPLAFKKLHRDSLFLLLFFIFFYTLSILQPNAPSYLLTIGLQLLLSCLIYLFSRSLTEFKGLIRLLRWMAPFITFAMFLLIVYFAINENTEYSQYTGYMVLPAAVISADALFDRFKFLHAANALVALMLIFISGARGPLACILLFTALKLMQLLLTKKKWKAFIVWVGIFSLPFILFGYRLLFAVSQFIIERGFSTRLLGYIAKDDVLNETGRDEIRNYVISLIGQHPLTGVGLGQDRMMINRFLGDPINLAIGNYPHNFFLELLVQYGLIVGSAVIFLFLRMIYFSFKRSPDSETRNVLFIFFAIGFFPLLFSGSYLNAPLLFAYLGFATSNVTVQSVMKKIV